MTKILKDFRLWNDIHEAHPQSYF